MAGDRRPGASVAAPAEALQVLPAPTPESDLAEGDDGLPVHRRARPLHDAGPGRRLYPALAILISATGFAGFSFTYFGPIIGGSYPAAEFPLHLHGWSFFLWYLLFPLQARC